MSPMRRAASPSRHLLLLLFCFVPAPATTTRPLRTRRRSQRDIVDVTLTTQCSLDRTWLLRGLYDRWKGPLVAAVYVPYGANETEDVLSLRSVPNVTVLFTNGTFDETAKDYPVNSLRNLAIDHVTTSHYLMVDVDMWPSDGLHDELVRAMRARKKDRRVAVVVPPFSYVTKFTKEAGARLYVRTIAEGRKYDDILPRRIADLRRCYFESKANRRPGERRCAIFDRKNRGGHSSTDVDAWWSQRSGQLRRIPCIDSERYEPYAVVSTAEGRTLRYTDALRGYGKNKVLFVQRMWLRNFTFDVFGGGFLFHHPHLVSASMKAWRNRGDIKHSPMKRENDAIFESALSDETNGSMAGELVLNTPCCDAMVVSTFSTDLPGWCGNISER